MEILLFYLFIFYIPESVNSFAFTGKEHMYDTYTHTHTLISTHTHAQLRGDAAASNTSGVRVTGYGLRVTG